MKPHQAVNGELSGIELEKALAGQLREILSGVPWLSEVRVERFPVETPNRAFDLSAEITLRKGKAVELWVDCKSNPRPSQFPYVGVENESASDGTRRSRIRVFAAPYIAPRMAETCWKHGWSWFDLAGNCRINVPDVLYIERTGREPVHRPPRPSANLSTPEAARVIRALLAPENAGARWTQRYLELHFGQLKTPIPRPSLGLVNKVVRHLHEEAYIEMAPEGGFRVNDPLKLLFAWRDVYRFDRHTRHGYFTFLQGRHLTNALAGLESITGGHAAYAAFSAADIQAPNVRQPKTWLFLDAMWEEEFEEVLEAKRVDSGENLVVLIPNDDGVFYQQEGAPGRLPCTNPVQTYVDLYHAGGRGHEAAESVLEKCLKPDWRLAGLDV